MPDPKPLSPEEVNLLASCDVLTPAEKRLIATVRHRERQIAEAWEQAREAGSSIGISAEHLPALICGIGDRAFELQEQLADESPGTPLGRLKALSEWAQAHCGYNPASARGHEVAIIEHVESLERQLAAWRRRR